MFWLITISEDQTGRQQVLFCSLSVGIDYRTKALKVGTAAPMLMLIKETHVSAHTVGPVPWLLTTQI